MMESAAEITDSADRESEKNQCTQIFETIIIYRFT